ncbi:hypothetical protein [Winogradskyella immobilis]|uniref:Uncharacterized protein n=1 Tax=Winogradskyella immobilis TaxID=2816852 RepID=A0ABS8EQN5_9FLAO|nr:hypothetical protein [Winogradskyella immobilis]MCC1485530.1 hypothetical protein [Winogradskyella immobilis]MCG0017622.1 hypothetical protein [Winogradskyella immobilis]
MTTNKFKIELLKTNWISEEDTQTDLCAHGQMRVKIGNEIVVDQTENDGWTISATAQLLLRTLERNHTKENPVGDQLIPCCGHFLVFDNDMEEVYIGSCPTGIDWEVTHENGIVTLKTESGTETQVDFENYKSEVLNFVDQVEEFYKNSPEKEIPKDEFDRKGYLQFWKEWNEKRNKWKK